MLEAHLRNQRLSRYVSQHLMGMMVCYFLHVPLGGDYLDN